MGKEVEILDLLRGGLVPVDVIGKGYAKSTVYKVNQYYTGKKTKISKRVIRQKYTIISLKQEARMVLLTLAKYRPPPSPEELERAKIEAELEIPQDPFEEEKQVKKVDFSSPTGSADENLVHMIIKAMKKESPEMFKALESTPYELDKILGSRKERPGKIMRASSISFRPHLELWITNEQYSQLGRPSLFQVVEVNLRL